MNFKKLKDELRGLGIAEGDILYVASDVSLLLHEEVKLKAILSKEEYVKYLDRLIDALKELVGLHGTLMFPVFTWGFCRNECFDYLKTPGECGVLSNRTLEREDFIRTKHPMYSFCVYGKYAEDLKNMNNTDSWSKDSPFAWLHKNGAKQLCINVSSQRGLTFMHYVEQQHQVKYRYMKVFKGKYKDEFGNVSEREYSMYVRDLGMNPVNEMPDDFLIKHRAAREMVYDKIRFQLISLSKAYDVMSRDIKENNAGNIMYYKK